MPNGLDFASDKGCVEFVKLARQYTLPDFVKQADMVMTQNPTDVAISTFADPLRKQFYCHTKAATWINYLFFLEKKAEFHPKDQGRIQERFNSFIRYWGIEGATKAAEAQWEAAHKTAEDRRPDSEYAMVWEAENGRKERSYPLTTRMEVKCAAEWLHTYCDRIPFQDRNVIATKILDKTASYGADLGEHREFVEKQAGRGVGDPREIATMIDGRALLAKDDALRTKFAQLAHTVRTQSHLALQPDQLVKLAHTVDMMDRAIGLAGRYTELLPRPEDVIFSATFTKAAAAVADHVALTTGRVYEKAALCKVSRTDLRELMGDDFLEQVSSLAGIDPEKMASEVATLPRPDAEMLEGLFAENGIAPVMSKAANAFPEIRDAEFERIAAMYSR